jgi:hypothetical protein
MKTYIRARWRQILSLTLSCMIWRSTSSKEAAKGRRPHSQPSRWILPPNGVCKLNVDGSVARSLRQGAVGAVCQSHSGVFLDASTVVFEGVTNPGCLEAMACRKGMALISQWSERWGGVDRGRLFRGGAGLQGLQAKNLGLFSNILREIKESALIRGNTTFRHEGRRSNVEAHRLAQAATSFTSWSPCLARYPPRGSELPCKHCSKCWIKGSCFSQQKKVVSSFSFLSSLVYCSPILRTLRLAQDVVITSNS